MLSLVKAAKMKKLALPTVVMEVNSRQTLGLVRRTFGDSVVPILTGAFAAKMTMQAILKPGIGEIFREFLTFSGSEFYFLPVPTSLVSAAI